MNMMTLFNLSTPSYFSHAFPSLPPPPPPPPPPSVPSSFTADGSSSQECPINNKKRKNYATNYNNKNNNFVKGKKTDGKKSGMCFDPLRELAYYTSLMANYSSPSSGSVTAAELNGSSASTASSVSVSRHNGGAHCELTKEILSATSYSEVTRVLNKCLPSIHNSPKSIVLCMKQIAYFAEKEGLLSNVLTSHSSLHAANKTSASSFAYSLSVDDPRRVVAMSSAHFIKEKKKEKGNPRRSSAFVSSSSSTTSESMHLRDETDVLKLIKVLAGILCHILKQNASLFDPDDLVGYMFCLAKCGVKQTDNYRLIATEIECRPQLFSIQELQEVLWAYTRCLELNGDAYGGINIASYDSDFLAFLAQQFIIKEVNLNELDPQQLGIVVKCLNRLSYKNITLLQLLGKVLLKKQKQFNDKDWGLCVLAFSRFGVPLRDECKLIKKLEFTRDWRRPPPPKKPKPMSFC